MIIIKMHPILFSRRERNSYSPRFHIEGGLKLKNVKTYIFCIYLWFSSKKHIPLPKGIKQKSFQCEIKAIFT